MEMSTGLDWDYNGFDMSGYGNGDDDRSPQGQEQCRKRNFQWLQQNHHKDFLDLSLEKFELHAWKGSIWWGKSHFQSPSNCLNEEYIEKDFTSWNSKEIVDWLKENRPGRKVNRRDYISNNISRIISREDRYNVLKRQKWNCNQCGCKLKYKINSDWDGEVAHIDHIHPFSSRGSYPNGEFNINELSNLQALCPKCNLSKTNKEGFH